MNEYPVLIGITGKAGSGKDTAFGFIHEWADKRGVTATRRAFADSLKHSFTRLFIPDASREEAVQWCNELKNNGRLLLDTHREIPGQKTTLTEEISIRLALQRYGTEAHREIFGDSFWVDDLLPTDRDWSGNFYQGFGAADPEICVVTDVRFDDEAQRVVDLGGRIIQINRPMVDVGDGHQSEAGVDPKLCDLAIANTGDLYEFRTNIFRLMDFTYGDLTERHD